MQENQEVSGRTQEENWEGTMGTCLYYKTFLPQFLLPSNTFII